MTVVILLALVVFMFYRSRVFLAKAWLAFAMPFARKVEERAEQAVVDASVEVDRPLSREQADDIRERK